MRNNKIHIKIFYLSLALLVMGGCQKASINGNLDGRWQILEITIGDEVSDTKDQQLYYNFNLHVCSLSYYGSYFTSGNMIYGNNNLFIDFPHIVTPDGFKSLTYYGIYSNPVTFEVLYLSKSSLILKEGEDIIITLRKF